MPFIYLFYVYKSTKNINLSLINIKLPFIYFIINVSFEYIFNTYIAYILCYNLNILLITYIFELKDITKSFKKCNNLYNIFNLFIIYYE